ncbi:MAG: hypothetical protein BRD46_02070 [Bacteroidetes bacterium QS_8_68_15]|nr:MAG: hypothetical protein BRD46_02070 [Bacteroidetes bacterium QS_8_68_15]
MTVGADSQRLQPRTPCRARPYCRGAAEDLADTLAGWSEDRLATKDDLELLETRVTRKIYAAADCAGRAGGCHSGRLPLSFVGRGQQGRPRCQRAEP